MIGLFHQRALVISILLHTSDATDLLAQFPRSILLELIRFLVSHAELCRVSQFRSFRSVPLAGRAVTLRFLCSFIDCFELIRFGRFFGATLQELFRSSSPPTDDSLHVPYKPWLLSNLLRNVVLWSVDICIDSSIVIFAAFLQALSFIGIRPLLA